MVVCCQHSLIVTRTARLCRATCDFSLLVLAKPSALSSIRCSRTKRHDYAVLRLTSAAQAGEASALFYK